MVNKNKNYQCSSLTRFIYKSIGITLLILLSISYWFVPTFWKDKEHIALSAVYSCFWMITRAGIKEVNHD